MKLKLLLVPVLALAGILGVSSYAGASPVPQTRTINVGGGGSGIAANGFFPNLITINKGDTINFLNPYEELHTVTFLPQRSAHARTRPPHRTEFQSARPEPHQHFGRPHGF